MQIPKWLEKFRDAFNWGWLAYRIIYVLAFTGILGAIGGGIWAVLIGVPLPIAIMAGYCTFVGAVYLGLAPLMYRVLAQVPVKISSSRKPPPPNYTAVRLMHEYELIDASKLWCDMHPQVQHTFDSESWFQALRAAIQSKELEFIPKYSGQDFKERKEPTWDTRVSREALKKYAASINQNPRFLLDRD
jgi:hypothetical protein